MTTSNSPRQALKKTRNGRIGVIVEERFFRSCFPGIEIEPFQRDLDRRYLKSLRAIELLARGVSRTASMECVRAAEAVDR